MAISRVPGYSLLANLDRQGTDLTITSSGLVVTHWNVTNQRFGIGTDTPTATLTVNGDIDVNANASINFGQNILGNVANPLSSFDAANKYYVDSQIGSAVIGNTTILGTSTDGNLTQTGAYNYWTTSTTVTDAIDDLNETVENIRNNTYVKSVDFTADNTVGGAGLVVTLTITAVGNANRYTIDWGDGDTTTATTDSTPTHTYSTNTGSPFDVTVTAFNNSG